MKRLLLAFALLTPGAVRADAVHAGSGNMISKLPEYHASDASAPAVDEANLLASERFWPYQTALTKPWQSLPAGALGVLIRIESGGRARIDFGRDGLAAVPVSATDLVARANAIRRGETKKDAPNFLYAIAPRLLDSTREDTHAFPFDDAATHTLFLSVFADPWRREFAGLVASLEPLRARADLLTILFPQSRRPDSQVGGQLRAMKWTPPFVYAHLSEPYTETLLDDARALPAVLLTTADGRVLYEGRLTRDVLGKLEAALRSPSVAGE